MRKSPPSNTSNVTPLVLSFSSFLPFPDPHPHSLLPVGGVCGVAVNKAVMSVIDKSPFRAYDRIKIDALFARILRDYSISFMGGDEDKAKQRLFGIAPKPSIWLMFRMGMQVM